MMFHVTHTSTFSYSQPVSLCHNLVHLRPRPTANQSCVGHHLAIRPTPAFQDERRDFFGNDIAFFVVQEKHRKLVISATSHVDVQTVEPPAAHRTPCWESVRDQLAAPAGSAVLDAVQYVFESPFVPRSRELTEMALRFFTADRPMLEAVLDLTAGIHHEFKYDPAATDVFTPLSEVLRRRRGVCQDFAHLGIGCLRSLGMAARYVSGYLLTTPPPGQQKMVGADASHAWFSVWIPGVGWVDVDPTNNVIPSQDHITIGWGRDYGDVSPVKGMVLGGGVQTLSVAVDVTPGEGGIATA
ncbi:MAG: transglutaminase family protein [Planctomycetia bacterium]